MGVGGGDEQDIEGVTVAIEETEDEEILLFCFVLP